MLLVVGAADPQDPPPNIADAPVELPRSTTVVAPGHGHGVADVGCMPGPIAAFVDAGTAAALDVRCAANVPVPSFITWP